jgi:hypothetical protein
VTFIFSCVCISPTTPPSPIHQFLQEQAFLECISRPLYVYLAWGQVLFAKQALYCLNHTSSPFCSGYFGDGVL